MVNRLVGDPAGDGYVMARWRQVNIDGQVLKVALLQLWLVCDVCSRGHDKTWCGVVPREQL